jgi:hypothetical protein
MCFGSFKIKNMPLEFPISFSRLPSTEGPYHFVGEWVGRRSADIT